MKAHDIARDLKTLIGYGATPQKLIAMPRLVALIDHPPETPPRVLGMMLAEYLKQTIARLSGEYHLPGFQQALPAAQVQNALIMLLSLSRDAQMRNAPARRARAIRILGLPVSVEQWRRPDGPEFELMLILAQTLNDAQSASELAQEIAAAVREMVQEFRKQAGLVMLELTTGQITEKVAKERLDAINEAFDEQVGPIVASVRDLTADITKKMEEESD